MTERLIVPVQWKAAEGDDGVLEGYASVFDVVDLQDDLVERGAFTETTKRINAKGIPLLADHDASTTSVLGTIFAAAEEPRGLRVKAQFSSAASAQDVRTKMIEGHIRSMSIGYEPIEVDWKVIDGRNVRLLKQVKLWEVSVVVFPANPEALVSRVKNAIDRELRALTGGHPPTVTIEFPAEHARRVYDDITTAKTAIASHSTATSQASWDEAANAARFSADAGAATYRRGYAWQDPSADPDTKSAYKFLHHEIGQDGSVGPANLTACSAGIGALNGARGGTTIPAADRAGVYAHLARHLRDSGATPPDLASHHPRNDPQTSHPSQDPPDEPPNRPDTPVPPVEDALLMHKARADNLLAGRDADAVADPATLARITTRLEWEPKLLADLQHAVGE